MGEFHAALGATARAFLGVLRVHWATVLVGVRTAVFIRVTVLAPDEQRWRPDEREQRYRRHDVIELFHKYSFRVYPWQRDGKMS